MTVLAAQVRVRRRYQRSIRIDSDLNEASALEGFVCPASTAHSLLNMARQVAETAQGAFTWTGPYGGGKSSLAVALAALLGPEGRKRVQARAAIGERTANELLSLLKTGRRGWTTLPVVGSRSDPVEAIAQVLSDHKRIRQGGAEKLVDHIKTVARDAPGSGLLVVIDEMGKFLEYAATGGGDVYFFQQLAEAASRSHGRLIVVGILHQAFDDYAHRLSREVRDEWLKIQGRFADVPINVVGEEMIALIGCAIEAKAPRTVRPLAVRIAEAIRRNRPGTGFHLDDEIAACWPLHPVVACLLGPLSRRRFGQNQRSVLGFLNSAEPHGFQEFLNATPAGGRATYDTTMLWDYLRANLEPSILASPDGHRWSVAVEALERCESRGGALDHLRLVKTIALIDLFKDRSGLVPSLDVLGCALSDLAMQHLQGLLGELSAWSIVIYKKFLDGYAVYAGSDFDIDAAVGQAYAQMTGIDFARLRQLAAPQPILAKRHYHSTGTLRWFDVDIAPLADAIGYIRRYRPHNGATGLFLLLIPTELETQVQAERTVDQALEVAGDVPVAVGWSSRGLTIRDTARELLALESVRAERTELNGDPVARREVDARIMRVAAELEEQIREAFLSVQWKASTGRESDAVVTISPESGLAGLNGIASTLADHRYSESPRVHNELLNRIKPSSNAIAAQKALLKAMIDGLGEDRLGIDGFPAHGGLYASLLEATGLYPRARKRDRRYGFTDPSVGSPANLAPLWKAADEFLRAAGPAGARLSDLFELWEAPPYGLRNGLFPILAIAYILCRSSTLGVYLDDVFQPRVTSLLTDRLGQDRGCVRVRWNRMSKFQRDILLGVAKTVADHVGLSTGDTLREPLEIARALVGVITSLTPWTLKTMRLSPIALRVRDLAKLANDPNKFLLDDIPLQVSVGAATDDPSMVIAAVRAGLSELVAAYPKMLREMAAGMLRELRIPNANNVDLAELQVRAENVKGLTGNYRLDAFATRLAMYSGAAEEIEAIASLATNKPPRDWVDRDIDHAQIEVAALGREFVKAEGLAHVKGRSDRRHAMALVFGDPRRPSPVTPQIDVTIHQHEEVTNLVGAIRAVLEEKRVDRDIALAALAELGSELGDPASTVIKVSTSRSAKQKRVG